MCQLPYRVGQAEEGVNVHLSAVDVSRTGLHSLQDAAASAVGAQGGAVRVLVILAGPYCSARVGLEAGPIDLGGHMGAPAGRGALLREEMRRLVRGIGIE